MFAHESRAILGGSAMKLPRRRFLRLAVGAAAMPALPRVARAQAFPSRPVLLTVGPSSTINATLYDKLGFVFLRDIAPVASTFQQPQVMLAHPSLAAKTVPELVAYAKANPGKITMASAGTGSSGHLAGELFKMPARVK